jgi:hypothetical protein
MNCCSLLQADGGFGYWHRTSADVALTAYILRFLTGASDFIEVDPAIKSNARAYLIAQQTPSGAWTSYDWSTKRQRDDPMKTAYVARALSTSSESLEENDRAMVNTSVAMDAMSAPSILYDYYNPEANAVVTPVRFAVH